MNSTETGAAAARRGRRHERLLVRLGDGPGLRDARHQPVPVRVGAVDAHSHRGRRHHRPRVGARRSARSACARCHGGGWSFPSAPSCSALAIWCCIRASAAVAGKLGWTSQGEHAAPHRRQRRNARGTHGAVARRSASSSWRRTRKPSASVIASTWTTAPPAMAARRWAITPWARPISPTPTGCTAATRETILTSILDGRNGVMPPLESALGHNGANEVAAYVVSRQRHAGRRRTGSRRARRGSTPCASPVTARMAAAIRRWARPISSTAPGSMAAASRASWPACATGATASCRRGASALPPMRRG